MYFFGFCIFYSVLKCCMMEMSTKILFVILIYFIFVKYCTCVECWERDFETSVHGISEVQDFKFCHNKDSVVVNYYSCIIPFVKLPVNRITKTFPSVKIINWACRAECYVEASNLKIEVRGCTAGEYRFLMFQLYYI